MKVGIHFPDLKPEAGGASSLLKTIQKEIVSDNDKENEYIFIYNGGKKKTLLKSINGFNYLNIDYYYRQKFLKKIKRFIKILLKIPNQPIPIFDLAAKDQKIDLFWFTSPGLYEISYPFIYTVWDLGHRRTPFFPEVSRSGWIWEDRERVYKKMLFKASYILTGNEEGKKEILENYPMPEDKIRISPFPVASFCYGDESKPKFEVDGNFFFYPAQFWPHKNHICILNALVYLRKKYKLKPIVFFTGSDKGNKKYIEKKINELELQKQVIFTGFLKDEELKYLYTHATAMIFASLMGPNNMPPIESTFLNCPVIITDLEGHKEQLKDTALFFNGYQPIELANHMYSLITDNNLRNELIKKQLQLGKTFNNINYFSCVKKIINEFSSIRMTWGDDFIHL